MPHATTGRQPGGRLSPPAGCFGGVPEESDMSLMDFGMVSGALVFLALLGLFVYKMYLKN